MLGPTLLALRFEGLLGGPKKKQVKIGKVQLKGPIANTTKTPGARNAIEALEKAEKEGYNGLLLDINSPGGSPGLSEEFYRKVMHLRKNKGMKVVSVTQEMAASGGMWSLMPADKVYSLESAITGSIGVVSTMLGKERLLEKLGVRMEHVTAGKNKRAMDSDKIIKALDEENAGKTPDESSGLALLRKLQTGIHEAFIKGVLEGRHSAVTDLGKSLTEAELREVADGRVFTGPQALALKLIDEIGGIEEATEALKQMLDAPKAEVVNLMPVKKPGLITRLVPGLSAAAEPNAVLREAIDYTLSQINGGLPIEMLNKGPLVLWDPNLKE